MKESFEAYIGLSIGSAVVAAALILETGWFSGISAATLVFLSLALYNRADSIASKQGKSGTTKLGLELAPFVTEIILVGAVASTAKVPVSIGFVAVAAISTLEVLRLSIISDMKKVMRPSIDRNWRMIILGITFLLSSNPFYLFFGILAVAGAATYDLVDMLYRALYR